MSKKLIIAEKPSVARDIARVLKCNKKTLNGLENDKYIVTWALGHLVTLKEPNEIDTKYKSWKLADLPILPSKIPLKSIRKTASQYKVVKELFNNNDVDEIICATDAGREGELIFRLIYEYSKSNKPFKRLWISSMTDEAIIDGFKKIKNGSDFDSLYYSSICRAYADWYIGMNASRVYSIKYNAKLSVGRVQTPTLALIVKRQNDIDSFVPQLYYTINADFGDYEANWFDIESKDLKTNKQIQSKEKAESIVVFVKGKNGTIVSNDTDRNTEIAPQLFDLTSLQRAANQQLGFTAKKVLSLAQELYEKYKLLTYPRTDSKYLSDDLKAKIPGLLDKLPEEYIAFVDTAKDGIKKNSKRIFNNEKVSDHHAIIPTGKKINWDSLPPDCALLLKMVIQRFISAFFPPCLTDVQKIITKVENHHFICTGKTIVDLGWREVEKPLKKKKSNKEDDKLLPKLSIGDIRKLVDAKIKEEKTKPPEYYNDASLLSAMENAGRLIDDDEIKNAMKGSGLGTPATRAAIIERLISVNYLIRNKNSLIATEKGKNLIQVIPEELASPELTGKWELSLENIYINKINSRELSSSFLTDIRNFTINVVDNGIKAEANVKFDKEEKYKKTRSSSLNINCPLCSDGKISENSKAFYCSNWNNGCKFTIWKNTLKRSGGPIIDKKLITLLFKNKEIVGSTGTIKLDKDKVNFIKKS